MAGLFIECRGNVFIATSGGGSGGWYSLAGLNTSGGGASPILLTGAELTDKDLVEPVSTIGGTKILYVFGQAFGDVRIIGLMLGGKDTTGGKGFKTVTSFFKNARVGAGGSPVALSLPGGVSYNIYVVGFGTGQPDSEYNAQPFILHGLIAEPPN